MERESVARHNPFRRYPVRKEISVDGHGDLPRRLRFPGEYGRRSGVRGSNVVDTGVFRKFLPHSVCGLGRHVVGRDRSGSPLDYGAVDDSFPVFVDGRGLYVVFERRLMRNGGRFEKAYFPGRFDEPVESRNSGAFFQNLPDGSVRERDVGSRSGFDVARRIGKPSVRERGVQVVDCALDGKADGLIERRGVVSSGREDHLAQKRDEAEAREVDFFHPAIRQAHDFPYLPGEDYPTGRGIRVVAVDLQKVTDRIRRVVPREIEFDVGLPLASVQLDFVPYVGNALRNRERPLVRSVYGIGFDFVGFSHFIGSFYAIR